jgi:hypothetical protein
MVAFFLGGSPDGPDNSGLGDYDLSDCCAAKIVGAGASNKGEPPGSSISGPLLIASLGRCWED